MSKSNAAEQLPAEEFTTDENFAKLFEETYGGGQLKEGSLVKGVVISVTDDAVTIDVGLKSEGRIPLKEFYNLGEKPEINPGDEVEVYLEKMESRMGDIVISRERALKEKAWEKLEKEHKKNNPIDGILFGQVKGGFTIDLGGAVAFLPGSQLDVKPVKDPSDFAHIKQKYLILKMDKKRGNIIVSRRALLEESRNEAREEMLKGIALGQVMKGTVKNLTNYGAFIDLGGLDGLLHVTDISWKRINHPSEVLRIGQQIDVQVIKYDEETKRVSLGMKQLEEDNWGDSAAKFSAGETVKGKVVSLADYGVFVDIGDGIEGLIHNNDLSWVKKNQNANKITKVGEELEVKVLDIDNEKRRISLGLKQLQANPWQDFAANFKEGDIVEGEVKNISDFGFFLGLDGGIDGLVHYSDLAWDRAGEEVLKEYKKGQKVSAKILNIDVEKERVGLGVKQLAGGDDSAGGESVGGVDKGQTVTCTVESVEKDGIEVSVGDNKVRGFIKRADLSRDRSEQRPERFAIGDRVDAKVLTVTKKTGKLTLSVKALEIEEHKRAIEEYGSTDSGASLGDILGAAIEKKKKK